MVVYYRLSELLETDSNKFNSELTIKDLKNMIEKKTGINPINQKFKISITLNYFEQQNDLLNFFDLIQLKIYDLSNFDVPIKKGIYEKKITLDLNNNIEQLKKTVYEKIKIPIERQIFFINDWKQKDNRFLNDVDILENNISIKISKALTKSLKYFQYPNSEKKELYVDLLDTGLELLEKIYNKKIVSSKDKKI